MVRPIEITDSISKVQALERMQQNAKAAIESVQQFQKELNEKLSDEQVRTARPAPEGDRIVFHAEERERRKQDSTDHPPHGSAGQEPPRNESGSGESDKDPPHTGDHIDIIV